MCERGQGHRVIKPLLHARESCACRKITCVASATNGAEERRESLRTSEPRPADARSRPAATERTRVAQVAPVSRTSGLGGEQGQKMGTTRPLRAANFSSRDRPAHSRSRVTLTTPWTDTVPLSRARCAERPRGAPSSVSFEFERSPPSARAPSCPPPNASTVTDGIRGSPRTPTAARTPLRRRHARVSRSRPNLNFDRPL